LLGVAGAVVGLFRVDRHNDNMELKELKELRELHKLTAAEGRIEKLKSWAKSMEPGKMKITSHSNTPLFPIPTVCSFRKPSTAYTVIPR